MPLVNRVPGKPHLPPIIPPPPEFVKMMKEASKPRGTTYEQALAQTRNSLKNRQPNADGNKPR